MHDRHSIGPVAVFFRAAWFASVCLIGIAMMGAAAQGQPADEGETESAEVVVYTDRPRQSFEGWGVSLAWWAVRVGDWPEERLDTLVHLLTDPDEGLGLNVFRYNIGSGDHPDHDHMRPGANVPAYKSAPDEPYNWSADSAQRRVLRKLMAAADKPIVEAFANSPPWWMTISGCSSGSADGSNNLREDQIQAYADYLANVAQHFRAEWGITFDTLEPFNEPQSGWWKAGGRQQGCHIGIAQQQRVIEALSQALERHGLDREIGISANDANSLNASLEAVRAYDAKTLSKLAQINTHSYHGDQREALRDFAENHGKRLWQSESGPLGSTCLGRMLGFLCPDG